MNNTKNKREFQEENFKYLLKVMKTRDNEWTD